MFMARRRPLLGAAMVGGGAYVAGKRRQESMQREADQEARIQELEAQQGGGYGAPPPPMPPAPPAPPPPAPVADAPAPAPAAPAGGDMVSQLKQLKDLLDAGVLTQDEFDAAKQKLLAS